MALLLSFALPDIALDTGFADLVVSLTNTATFPGFPLLAIVVIGLVAARHGLHHKRGAVEAGAATLAMLLIVLGVTLFNEHLLKPLLAIPRPNIVELTSDGALGADIPDAEAIYALGDKEVRRTVLAARLPAVVTPALSDSVRAHWVHETGYSFPSGHTLAAATLATVLAGLASMWLAGVSRRVALTMGPVWAIGVAYSRVLLGVHRPVDVIAGAVIGIACGALVLTIVRTTISRPAPA